MRGHPDEIDRALRTLGDTVADHLTAAGWNRRVLDDDRAHATLTRATQNGVIAVIEIGRTSFQWPDDWPVEVGTSLGVGYEPALNLMPLFTLRPRAALIDYPEHGRSTKFTVQLTGPDSVAGAAQRIEHFVYDHGSTITQSFPDAAAIDEHLRREIERTQPRSDEENGVGDGDPGASDFGSELRLVVLAAMGKHDEARALVATYPAERTDRTIDRDDRRFVRQLVRWLDGGGPVAPPIEETLARLPRRARPARPSWSSARSESKAKKEALDAARARSKGKTLDQLKNLIAGEYSTRGIVIAPSLVDFDAEMLKTEQQPFGRARTAITAIRMLKSGVGEVIRLFRHESEEDPEWLQPPDRAAYPLIADRNRYTPVELDADVHSWLERVRTEAPRRMGPWVLIDVWLTREDPTGPLVVSIGGHRVGRIRESETKAFDQAMRAAALFDEDPFVSGRLTSFDRTGAPTLEIPLPERQGSEPVT